MGVKKWKLHYAIFGAFRASVSLSGLEPVAELALPVFAVTCGNVGDGKDLHDEMTAAQMETAVRNKLATGDYAGYAGTSRLAYVDFEAMTAASWPREKIVLAYRACVTVAPEFDWGMYAYPTQDLFKTVPGDLAAVRTINDGNSHLANLVRVKIPDFYMVVSTAADSEDAARVNIEETFRTVRDCPYQRTVPQIWPLVNPGAVAVSAAVFMAQAKMLYALGIRELVIWGQADNAPDAAALQAAIDGWEADFLAEYGDEDLTPVVRGSVAQEIAKAAASTDIWSANGWISAASISVTVPGSPTQILYNNAGALGASANLVWNQSNYGLEIRNTGVAVFDNAGYVLFDSTNTYQNRILASNITAAGVDLEFPTAGGTIAVAQGGTGDFQIKDAGGGLTAGDFHWDGTQNISNESDIAIDDDTKGIILKDNAGTPHYWRVTVNTSGTLVTTDLGTSLP